MRENWLSKGRHLQPWQCHAEGTRRYHLLADPPLETLSSHQPKLISRQPALNCLRWRDLHRPCDSAPAQAAQSPSPAQALCRIRPLEHSLWLWNNLRFYPLACAGSVCTVLLSVGFFSLSRQAAKRSLWLPCPAAICCGSRCG